ncbi:MAG: vanadium-dependent haloperoxidase [Blastocatellia bacterium]
MNIKFAKLLLSLGGLFICLLAMTPPAFAEDNVALQWDQTALQAVRNTRMGPPMVARALAITHTSMYDAWAAYDPVAVGTRLGGTLRRPTEEHTLANKQKAVSYAAYRALLDLFPASQHEMFARLMTGLGYDPNDNSTDTATPAGIGAVAAAAVIAYRHRDGANQLGDLHPGAYSDYTGYRPVNDPEYINDPNRWQPLRLPNGQVQSFLAPHWGLVLPFAMTSASQFRPDRAPAFFEHRAFGWPYLRQALEVLYVSANLGDREKMISEYWADGPATETPPGHWCLLAQFVSRRDRHGLDDDVKMFFALTNGLLDAGIAVWECKRVYDYVRPVTAIRYLFKGQRVKAWAGPFRGAQYVFGEDWQPYQPASFITPPFGEYVSGHSAFSTASAEVLKSFTGSDDFGASVTLPAGSSRIEPGLTPVADITLNWATFSEAAEEASLSRLYGGIHFSDGNVQGRIMGRKIGAAVWKKAQAYFQGVVPGN